MLSFAIDYKKALRLLTADIELNMQKYELRRDEWKVAEQLRDVLKVRISFKSMLRVID
jgi:hypothetical protein